MQVTSACDSLTQSRNKREKTKPVTAGFQQSPKSFSVQNTTMMSHDTMEGRTKNNCSWIKIQVQNLILSPHLHPSNLTRPDTRGQQHMEVYDMCCLFGAMHFYSCDMCN